MRKKLLLLFVILAAGFGAAFWIGERVEPDGLEKRKALVEQIEACKTRERGAKRDIEDAVRGLEAIRGELDALKKAKDSVRYNARVKEYNLALDRAQAAHRGDNEASRLCAGLQARYNQDR